MQQTSENIYIVMFKYKHIGVTSFHTTIPNAQTRSENHFPCQLSSLKWPVETKSETVSHMAFTHESHLNEIKDTSGWKKNVLPVW